MRALVVDDEPPALSELTYLLEQDGRFDDVVPASSGTDALRALLTNLRRIAAGADRHQSRYGDLVRLARWFDDAADDRAHELWASTFGLHPARHLSFAAEPEGDAGEEDRGAAHGENACPNVT